MKGLREGDYGAISDDEGDVLILELPSGEKQHYAVGKEGEGERFFAAWDALPEDIRQKNLERSWAALKDDNRPLRVVFQSGGRVILAGSSPPA